MFWTDRTAASNVRDCVANARWTRRQDSSFKKIGHRHWRNGIAGIHSLLKRNAAIERFVELDQVSEALALLLLRAAAQPRWSGRRRRGGGNDRAKYRCFAGIHDQAPLAARTLAQRARAAAAILARAAGLMVRFFAGVNFAGVDDVAAPAFAALYLAQRARAAAAIRALPAADILRRPGALESAES